MLPSMRYLKKSGVLRAVVERVLIDLLLCTERRVIVVIPPPISYVDLSEKDSCFVDNVLICITLGGGLMTSYMLVHSVVFGARSYHHHYGMR